MIEQKSALVTLPLQDRMAKQIVQRLAHHESHKIRFSTHAKERMIERGVSIKQVMTILKDTSSRLTEKPHLTAGMSWKFNLLGMAAGEILEVVIDLKNVENDPNAFVVTVMIK